MMLTLNKHGYNQTAPVCLALVFILLILSCAGQPNRIFGEEITSITTALRPDSLAPWVDPLFFIEGQLCQHVRKIYEDKSGNLWFGTNIYGLMRYNGDTLEYFDEKDGLGGGRITGFVEDQEGNLWIGNAGGLSKYDGTSFRNFSENEGLDNSEIWSLILDRKGVFWMGTMEGVFRFDGKEFHSFPLPKVAVPDTTTILSYNRVSSMLEDRNGDLWFGTDGFGLFRYNEESQTIDQKGFTHYTKENGLPGNNIYSLLEDSNGNVWIGSMYGGISRYNGTSFTNFTEQGIISGVEAGGLYEDKNGHIWFAAENHGVYRYENQLNEEVPGNKQFSNYSEKDGLNTNGIICIYEDSRGRFWFGGWGGLFRFDGSSFESVTKDGPWVE